MKSKLTLKMMTMIGLSVMSLNSFAYASPNSQGNYHSVDNRPVKASPVSHDKHDVKHDTKEFSPHRIWKTGSVLPKQYRAKAYQVYRYNDSSLQRPAKNQQWFKIKGDYVLVNLVNHHIIRIVNGR